ncbi:hypothetical protein [Candidatus Finniella inopinata]|nr:hypothetical protein [Candidatus Finniella inopinata]
MLHLRLLAILGFVAMATIPFAIAGEDEDTDTTIVAPSSEDPEGPTEEED